MDTSNTKASLTEQRIYWLDFVRSLAIFLVVLNHAVEVVYSNSPTDFASYSTPSAMFFLSAFNLGRHGVPLFLLLTGYLMIGRKYNLSSVDSSEKSSYFYFLKHSLGSLLLCIEIWIVIYHFFTGLFMGTPMGISSLFKKMLFLERVHLIHEWYIYMILGMYVVIPFASFLLNKLADRILLILLALIFFIDFVLPTLGILLMPFEKGPYIFQIDTTLLGSCYLFYAVLGYLATRKLLQNVKIPYLIVTAIVSFALGTLLEWARYLHNSPYLIWYDCVTLVPTAVCLFEFFSRIPFRASKITLVAKDLSMVSFGIYLIHPLFLLIIQRYIVLPFSKPLVSLVYLALDFLLSWGTVELIRQIPIIGNVILHLHLRSKPRSKETI